MVDRSDSVRMALGRFLRFATVLLAILFGASAVIVIPAYSAMMMVWFGIASWEVLIVTVPAAALLLVLAWAVLALGSKGKRSRQTRRLTPPLNGRAPAGFAVSRQPLTSRVRATAVQPNLKRLCVSLLAVGASYLLLWGATQYFGAPPIRDYAIQQMRVPAHTAVSETSVPGKSDTYYCRAEAVAPFVVHVEFHHDCGPFCGGGGDYLFLWLLGLGRPVPLAGIGFAH